MHSPEIASVELPSHLAGDSRYDDSAGAPSVAIELEPRTGLLECHPAHVVGAHVRRWTLRRAACSVETKTSGLFTTPKWSQSKGCTVA